MKIGILSKRTRMFTGKIRQCLENKGHQVTIYTLKDLIINETLLNNDFYILKSKSLFFIYAGYFLEANNVPVVPNPRISYLQKNRVHSHYLIKKIGLLRPNIFMGTQKTLIEKLEAKDFPLILKPIMGSGSRGVKMINTPEDLKFNNENILYLEKFIEGIHYNVYFIKNHVCTLIKPPLSHEHVPMDRIETPKDINDLIRKWTRFFNENALFGHIDVVREKISDKLYCVDTGSFPEYSNWKIEEISPEEEICKLILQQIKNWNKNQNN
jgi:hypothetical protein